jgi:hypothetical protein
MSGINFLSDNYLNSSNISITTGTANAQFPLLNLKNNSPSVKFRSSGNTVILEIDLLQTRSIDSIAVAGDPTEPFGMTVVSVKTSVTNDFSLSTSYPLTLYPAQNIGIVYLTSVSHRFVQISFTGQGSYVECGHIFIGERLNLTQNSISIGSFSYGYDDKSRVRENAYGQKFIDELPSVKFLGGSIEYCTKAEQELLDDMFIKHGKHEPLWVIVDKDGAGMNEGESKLTCYGYLDKSPVWSASGGQTFNTSIQIEQAI